MARAREGTTSPNIPPSSPPWRWGSYKEARTPILRDASTTCCPCANPPCVTLRESKLAHHVLSKTIHGALAGERDQGDVARLPGLEAHRGAGRDVEPHAARLLAVEPECRVGFEEVVVRADLDRPVAGVGHRQRHGLAAGVERDVAGFDEKLAGGHGASFSAYRLMHGHELRPV